MGKGKHKKKKKKKGCKKRKKKHKKLNGEKEEGPVKAKSQTVKPG